jgi:hypothetical protein
VSRDDLAAAAGLAIIWVGHAYLWTGLLNVVYGLPLPKWFLRPWRLLTGLVIVFGLPAAVAVMNWVDRIAPGSDVSYAPALALLLYAPLCYAVGLVVFPAVTLYRLRTPAPGCLRAERTEAFDLWTELGPAAVGDGKMRWAARLPFTDVFTVELTHQALAVPGLPAALDGLTVLVVSDLHFHGTPSRAWFDAVFDRLTALPEPDLVVMAGDVVDTDAHRAWVQPLLGRLTAKWGKFAVLGNHDVKHQPAKLRQELTAAGFTVLGNGWRVVTVRGERCLVVGHEGPWFRPAPTLADAPAGAFRVCVSHTPDNFPWAARTGCRLTVSGHVHGGQIRLPIIGSIFVPSVFGRRFDQGVHERPGGVLAVCRGLSGKEPLRVRCRPQVLRLTLVPGSGG